MKNTIDWVSRVRKDGGRPLRPYPGKVAGICSSSDGHFAGIRSANHLRAVLSHVGMEVISPQVSVPDGAKAFDENGNFTEERLRKGMAQAVQDADRARPHAVDAGRRRERRDDRATG